MLLIFQFFISGLHLLNNFFLNFLFFYFGAILGSFLNVIIYRWPISISIVAPRSFCPGCKKTIQFYNNIPIISFLLLKGKCYKCKNKISLQYLLIEMITGFLFLFSLNNHTIIESIFFIAISSIIICIAIIDYNYFIIPLKLSIINFFIIILYVVLLSDIQYHVSGMIIGLGYIIFIYLLTFLIIKKQPMGYGDFILMIILGLWLGPLKILLTIFLASIIGLVYGLLLNIMKGYKRNRKLPFGTFLSLSAIILYIIEIDWNLFRTL